MVTGEHDGTKRITSVLQFAPENLKALIHGSGGTSTDADEGTEIVASEWAEVGELTKVYEMSDDNPGSVKGGAEALEIKRVTATPGSDNTNKLVRTLTTSFSWGNFQSLSLWGFISVGGSHWGGMQVGFRNAEGETVYKSVNTATDMLGQWGQVTIDKGDMENPNNWGTDEIITEQYVRPRTGDPDVDHSLYLDAWDINRFGGSPVPILVDGSGLQQVNLRDTSDTVIDPAIKDGTAQANRSTHWQSYIVNTNGIIKAEEEGKIVVLTDIVVGENGGNPVNIAIKKASAGGQNITFFVTPATSFAMKTFREGLEGDAYDGSNAGSLYIAFGGAGTNGILTCTGYMKDA